MTGNDLIASALRLIGILSSGEVPSPEESNDAFMILNQMLDEWSADRGTIFTVTRQGPYNLTGGQQTYYLGPQGGPFQLDPVRTPKIDGIGVIVLTNPIQPLELPMDYLTKDQWAAIPVKNIASALPLKVWDDQGFPFRTLNVYPVPNVQVQMVVYAWVALTQFPDLFTDMVFPPAYLKALRYNLAIDLAPEYGVDNVSQAVVAQAGSSKMKLLEMNLPLLDLRCDPMLVNPRNQLYNWLSDTYVRRT